MSDIIAVPATESREPRRQSWLPRWMHRLYAAIFGYFWLPCPLCGEYSGGHEWRERDGRAAVIPVRTVNPNVARHRGICPACTRRGLGRYEFASPSSSTESGE